MADERSRRRSVPDNSYYAADVRTFLAATTDEILGALAARNEFTLDVTQQTLGWSSSPFYRILSQT
jgi:hypothetical protein